MTADPLEHIIEKARGTGAWLLGGARGLGEVERIIDGRGGG
jgi:hypothetical protein